MSNLDYIKLKQLYNSEELFHHGVKGQKWGVRKDKDKSYYNYKYKTFNENEAKISPPTYTTDTFAKDEQEKKRRNKKIRRTAGAILIGGAIVASLLINKHKKEKLPAINNTSNKAPTLLLTNTMQNVGKDTYVDDLLKEAKRKSSIFRDMKNMLRR